MKLQIRTPGDAGGGGWTILVGQNGVGKTTVLQAIILAALDPRPVTSLVPDAWTFVRSSGDEDPLTAEIELTAEDGAAATRSISGAASAYVEGDTANLGLPLLLAFSARRRIAQPKEQPHSENLEVERVRGLFATDHPLLTQDPFEILSSAEGRDLAKIVRDVVTSALRSDDGARLFPLVDALELKGRGGVTTSKQLLQQRRFVLRYGAEYVVRVGVEELSDGYQAMLAIVLEVLYQATLATGAVPRPESLEAVILIDEIEAHLHPRWQRTVVPLLREVFPRAQFVVTTHSPLVVGSARPGEVVVLDIGSTGAVEAEVLDERLGMLGADRIYEEVFGVPRTASPDLVEAERAYLAKVATGQEQTSPDLASLVTSAWEDAVRRGQR